MEPRTLVLNPWGTANRIASWQQAICLLVLKKAVVVASYDVVEHDMLTSQHWTLQIPAVVQLSTDMSFNKTSVKFSRSNMLTRDKFRCCYCPPSVARKPAKELTYDHVTPRCQGGKTEWKNVVMACKPCNRRKGGRTPKQAGMKMHFKAYVPETLPLTSPLVIDVSRIHPLWSKYLHGAQATG